MDLLTNAVNFVYAVGFCFGVFEIGLMAYVHLLDHDDE